eukprot:UN03955
MLCFGFPFDDPCEELKTDNVQSHLTNLFHQKKQKVIHYHGKPLTKECEDFIKGSLEYDEEKD